MLSKWAEKWWPTESIITPPTSFVLKSCLCPQSVFTETLGERSSMARNELTQLS